MDSVFSYLVAPRKTTGFSLEEEGLNDDGMSSVVATLGAMAKVAKGTLISANRIRTSLFF